MAAHEQDKEGPMNREHQSERVKRRLRVVQWAAWIDLILLVALLTSTFSKQRDFVHVLGPLHGMTHKNKQFTG